MSFEGMDIGEVEALAAQLDGNARALTAIVGVLGGLVEELERLWLGPAFSAFARDFDASHRPALLGAAQTLSDLHAKLVANIDQQLAASSAATEAGDSAAVLAGLAGGLLGAATLGDIGQAWNLLNTGFSVEGLVIQDPIDIIQGLAGDDQTLMELQGTKLLSWLPDTDQAQSIDQFLADSHVYTVTGPLDDIGTGLGYAGLAIGVGAAGLDAYDGNYGAAGGQLVNVASARMIMTGDPALVLGGIDLELAKADYDEITMGGPLPSLTWSNVTQEYIPDFTYLLPEEAWEEKGELLKLVLSL